MSNHRVAPLERPMYSVAEAARTLGLASTKTRAWLDGYVRKDVVYDPVIRPVHTGDETVTWGEFVELGYLREYRKANVPLQRLRPVITELRKLYGTPYPLALARPYVHDRDLVLQLQERNDLPASLSVVVRTGQGVIVAKPADRFLRKVEFDEDEGGRARRIWPAGRNYPVVIDPLQRGGRPTVDGISTERIWELHDADEPIEEIARVYDMLPQRVSAAVAYEEQHRLLVA